VRIAGDQGFLTVKGKSRGLSRAEFEYAIPVEDAAAMLDGLCEKPLIEKTRYRVPFGAHTWEVDEFHGANAGLVVAEVELASADDEPALPPWVGQEVSLDPRYFNANLVKRPFTTW
jgi:CYTH domain-containing protein